MSSQLSTLPFGEQHPHANFVVQVAAAGLLIAKAFHVHPIPAFALSAAGVYAIDYATAQQADTRSTNLGYAGDNYNPDPDSDPNSSMPFGPTNTNAHAADPLSGSYVPPSTTPPAALPLHENNTDPGGYTNMGGPLTEAS